jgi:hypothetical protein
MPSRCRQGTIGALLMQKRMAKLAHEKNCKTKPITIADLLSLHGARPDHARALAGWPRRG